MVVFAIEVGGDGSCSAEFRSSRRASVGPKLVLDGGEGCSTRQLDLTRAARW